MKIFRVDEENNLMQFNEQDFKQENFEEKLETWLKNNPNCVLENEKILIIGRQLLLI